MENQNTSEEEWEEMQRRFAVEGLDSVQLSSKQKSLYLWRWLVDAENNMVTSRKMLDKVREQHSNEMKEVETYVEHIRCLSSEKSEKLESDNADLRKEAEELKQFKLAGRINVDVQEIGKMIAREGLDEIISSTLEEQVAYLLVLRTRLIEELETERKQTKNLMSNLEEIKSVATSEHLLNERSNYEQEMKHQLDLTKQVKEDMKKEHDLAMNALQSRLDIALTTIQHLESGITDSDRSELTKMVGDSDIHLRNKLVNLEDRLMKLQHVKRQLEIDNETLTFKISELLAECEEKEAQLRRERMKNVGIDSYSRQNSNETEISRKPPNNLDNRIMTSELSLQQQIRKLQQDVDNLQEQLVSVGVRHDTLATRYHQRKVDGKTKMQKIKDVFQVKQINLKDQIVDLENSLTVVQTTLSWEKECRQKIQSDFAIVQREKNELTKRLRDCDDDLREKSTQLKALNMRTTNLEEENAKICQEIAILKTILLKDVFINSSLEAKKKDSKDTVSSNWLNRLQRSSNQRSNRINQMETELKKENEEVTV